MAECEICGDRESQFIAVIQGAKLSVCSGCAKSGKIVEEIHLPGRHAEERVSVRKEVELVPDCSGRVKRA